MTDGPHHTDKAEAARQARRAREAAALRENLRRRKAQARAVQDPREPSAPPVVEGRAEAEN